VGFLTYQNCAVTKKKGWETVD